jgi:hypothetical protein
LNPHLTVIIIYNNGNVRCVIFLLIKTFFGLGKIESTGENGSIMTKAISLGGISQSIKHSHHCTALLPVVDKYLVSHT